MFAAAARQSRAWLATGDADGMGAVKMISGMVKGNGIAMKDKV
jgi:hypothetical protein